MGKDPKVDGQKTSRPVAGRSLAEELVPLAGSTVTTENILSFDSSGYPRAVKEAFGGARKARKEYIKLASASEKARTTYFDARREYEQLFDAALDFVTDALPSRTTRDDREDMVLGNADDYFEFGEVEDDDRKTFLSMADKAQKALEKERTAGQALSRLNAERNKVELQYFAKLKVLAARAKRYKLPITVRSVY